MITAKKGYNDGYTLSTGKYIYSNKGILGINNSADEITEGYDGRLWGFNTNGDFDPSDNGYLTKEELIEIADYAIERWKEFKDKLND